MGPIGARTLSRRASDDLEPRRVKRPKSTTIEAIILAAMTVLAALPALFG
jgi:hypothetical protein